MNGHSHNASHPLFGGAIKASIPTHFLDARFSPYISKLTASNFRDVPDNQEVFVSNLSETSLIFDILEHVNTPDPSAAEYHFDALATDNEVDDDDDTDDSRIFSLQNLPSSHHPHLPYPPTTFLKC
jgi:hypothetical protein